MGGWAWARRRGRAVRRGGTCTAVHVGSVLEFFSGIGGMRTAFQLASGSASSLPRWRALEVDEVCCRAYSEVFRSGLVNGVRAQQRWQYAPGQDEIWRCSIDKLPDAAFEGAELWLLSPPCQPFTRTGNHLDVKDRRCAALLRMLEALPKLSSPPRALLVENVPEFMGSKAHGRLRQALDLCGRGKGIEFEVEEFILDPTDFGFPNTRKRFYLLASRAAASRAAGELPPLPGAGGPRVPPRPVRDFCRQWPSVGAEDLRVDRGLLERASTASWQLDVVTAESLVTKTFTASYGKAAYASEGLSKAGPLLLTEAESSAPAEEARARFGVLHEELWGRVRYFSPTEILALQGFPESWALPSWLETRQQWRLIGNSINVTVVRGLMERLLAKM